MGASADWRAGRPVGRRRNKTAPGRPAGRRPECVLCYLLHGGRDLVSDEIIVRELLAVLERRRRARFPLELVR